MSVDVLVESILGQVRTIAEDVVRRNAPRLRTATVTGASPLRIRYDGEDDASVVTPRTLARVAEDDRVVVVKAHGQATVLGVLTGAARSWDKFPLGSGLDAAGHGAPPGMLREGNRRELRGRISRIGNNFQAGDSWIIATLAPDDRPRYTTRMLGQISGYANPGLAVVEVSSGGDITVSPSVETSWLGMDGIYWATT